MSGTPVLSLYIPTYNRSGQLLRLLECLPVQTLDPELWEVVVINNNSKDDTVEVFELFASALSGRYSFRMVTETRQGISHARNRGIAESRAEWVVSVDDDELIGPDFLERYYNFIQEHPRARAAGGRIVPEWTDGKPRWMSSYAERPIAGSLDLGKKVRPFPAGRYPGSGNMAIRKSVVEEFGGFDPGLGRTGASLLGGEEKDFFERIRKGGIKIWYVPDAVIRHLIPAERVTDEYFGNITYMVGVSERERTRGVSAGSFAARLFSECVKWGGTLALALGYTIGGCPSKGLYLVKMRMNITRGLLGLKRG